MRRSFMQDTCIIARFGLTLGDVGSKKVRCNNKTAHVDDGAPVIETLKFRELHIPRTALADVLMKSARTVALSTPIAVAGLMAVAVPVTAQSVLKVVPHADLRN